MTASDDEATPAGTEPSAEQRERILLEGAAGIVGRVADSSNATFVVELTHDDGYAWAIYKPVAGERPLWDFEAGLHKRERAAYLLDEHLGWGQVPLTVIRDDLPLGVGSLQWFIEADPAMHYFRLLREQPDSHEALRRLAVFDYLANNTDRKAGHVLADADGGIWAIDHGLCFAAPYKLRTVIWDFAGEPIDDLLLDDVAPLAHDVPQAITDLLDEHEVRALRRRAQRLLDARVLPVDTSGRAWPWPLI